MVETILPEPTNETVNVDNLVSTTQVSSRRPNRTLVILAIIIIVCLVGLLAGVAYNYIVNHSRDNTRKQDLAYIADQAESFYGLHHYYPTLAEINSSSFAAFNPQGIDKTKFKDPSGTTTELASSPTPTGYAYETTPSGCNDLTTDCLHFKVVAIMSDNHQYTVDSQH